MRARQTDLPGVELSIEQVEMAPHTDSPTRRGIGVDINPAVDVEAGNDRPEAKPLLRFVIKTLVVAMLLAGFAGLFALSLHVSSQRASNATALRELFKVVIALKSLESGSAIDLTVRGPGPIPGLPGRTLSEGTTLSIRRWSDGEIYVRGNHDQGTLTYRFHDGSLYASAD